MLDELARSRDGLWPLTVFVGGCFLSNLALFPVMAASRVEHDPLRIIAIFSLGMLSAQPSLLGIWRVFGRGSLLFRTGTVLVVGSLWATGCLLGLSLQTHFGFSPPYAYESNFRTVSQGLLCLPLLVVALEVPLWFLKIVHRWRVARREEEPSHFSIADLLVNTGFIAFGLMFVRLAQSLYGDARESFWWVLPLLCGLVGFLSFLTNPGFVWLFMKPTWNRERVKAAVGFVLGSLILLGFWFGAVPNAGVAALLIFILTGVSTIGWGLLIFRLTGFQLFWGPVPQRVSQYISQNISNQAVEGNTPSMNKEALPPNH